MSKSVSPPKGPKDSWPLVVRAWLLLIFGTFLQRIVPMTWWGPLMGTPGPVAESGQDTSPRTETALSHQMALKDAIYRASRALPWTPTCLAKAFTAQRILRSWNSPGEVFIGLKAEGPSNWPAHAWLTHQGVILTGELEQHSYVPTTVYRVTRERSERHATNPRR